MSTTPTPPPATAAGTPAGTPAVAPAVTPAGRLPLVANPTGPGRGRPGLARPEHAWLRWPWPEQVVDGRAPLGFGGDYNPEQWPEDVWKEDAELMHEAGVNLVTIGVFSWARLQTGPDTWEFGWLDRVMDLMAEHRIAVDLATATASPPPWLTSAHPEVLPVDVQGRTLWQGGRQSYAPSSPLYRELSLELVERMAQRYGGHEALALWHIANELGCHNVHDYSDTAAAAFRAWLEERYGDVAALNEAWGTDFWSQHYSSFAEVLPPRLAPTFANPTQQLDFSRFSSWQLQEQVRVETEVLRRVTPHIPVTTNFMVMSHTKDMDYARWSADVDVVSNDHYVLVADPQGQHELSFSADQVRGLAGGGPWVLMESPTSAVNWQPVNPAKAPGQLRRNSLVQVARGADAVCFFQWRAAKAGAEKYHSALVPHAGADTQLFRDVTALGADLKALQEVAGSRAHADVALLFDYEAWWAVELDSHPSDRLRYRDAVEAWHRPLWEANVAVDVVDATSDLGGYRVVLVPLLHLVSDRTAAAVAAAAEAGAQVVVTYFSGVVDESDHIRLGGYPGAFRDLLGVRVEEFSPLMPGTAVRVAGEGALASLGEVGADTWNEPVVVTDAEVLARYLDGPFAGGPAITRAGRGSGAAWYVSTELDDAGRAALLAEVTAAAGVSPVAEATAGVEVVVRAREDVEYVFAIDHTGRGGEVAGGGADLLTGATHPGAVPVPPGGVVVLRRPRG